MATLRGTKVSFILCDDLPTPDGLSVRCFNLSNIVIQGEGEVKFTAYGKRWMTIRSLETEANERASRII